MDLYAYRMDPRHTPERLRLLANKAAQSGRVTVRTVDMRRFKEEVELLADIYNDAWSRNWGFVPFDRAEIESLVEELKPIFRPNYARFVDIDGRPAAVILALPDLNGVIARFNGRLLPFNWVPLLSRVIREDYRGARILLLGIRREYQQSSLAVGVLALLVRECIAEARVRELDWVEFSWVLECNKAMNALARLAAGPPSKTFRLYSRTLRPAAPEAGSV